MRVKKLASRESKPEGAGRNRLLGHYMDSMVYLTEKLDDILEK